MAEYPWERARRNMHRLEVLEAVSGGYTSEWFEEMYDQRTEATRYLIDVGFIERVPEYRTTAPHPFRYTERGHAFLDEVKKQIPSAWGGIDWKRAGEVHFPEPQ